MRIAVSSRYLSKHLPQGNCHFTSELFIYLAGQHPEHQFIFFFNRTYDQALHFPANVSPFVIRSRGGNPLSIRWWFDVRVPLALRKHKADIFVSVDGVCSLTTRIPQVLVVPNLAFLHHPKFFTRLRLLFYKSHAPKYLAKAKVVATPSEITKQEIIDRYNLAAGKIINVPGAAKPLFKPIEWEEKEQLKEKYADGCEYFVFVGGAQPAKNLLNLLKAFSLFKKRQHTNMKLVVAGHIAPQDKNTHEKLETYKFRSAVKTIGHLPPEQLAKVIAGAYALVYPGFFAAFNLPVLEAMQSGVPVIAADTGSATELGGEAALYANPNDPSEIADQMKLIFKDENLRSRLIEKGKLVAANYTWHRSANLMWTAIQQAVSK